MEKVQAGNFPFPDFSEICPICHGKDCAVRIGFYYRWALELSIDKLTITLLYVPVVRYLCRQKQKPKRKHHTFSLLPDTLVPYSRISIDLLIYILQLLIEQGHSIKQTLNKIDAISPDACMLSENTIIRLYILFGQTRIKLIIFFQQHGDRYRAPPDFSSCSTEQTFDFIMNYPAHQEEGSYSAAYYLSQDYYNQEGSYVNNARFLFGAASQFCK